MEAIISEKNDRVLGSSGSSNTAGRKEGGEGEERRGEERRGEGEGEEVTQCNLRLLYDSQSARNGLATFTESTHENWPNMEVNVASGVQHNYTVHSRSICNLWPVKQISWMNTTTNFYCHKKCQVYSTVKHFSVRQSIMYLTLASYPGSSPALFFCRGGAWVRGYLTWGTCMYICIHMYVCIYVCLRMHAYIIYVSRFSEYTEFWCQNYCSSHKQCLVARHAGLFH